MSLSVPAYADSPRPDGEMLRLSLNGSFLPLNVFCYFKRLFHLPASPTHPTLRAEPGVDQAGRVPLSALLQVYLVYKKRALRAKRPHTVGFIGGGDQVQELIESPRRTHRRSSGACRSQCQHTLTRRARTPTCCAPLQRTPNAHNPMYTVLPLSERE